MDQSEETKVHKDIFIICPLCAAYPLEVDTVKMTVLCPGGHSLTIKRLNELTPGFTSTGTPGFSVN